MMELIETICHLPLANYFKFTLSVMLDYLQIEWHYSLILCMICIVFMLFIPDSSMFAKFNIHNHQNICSIDNNICNQFLNGYEWFLSHVTWGILFVVATCGSDSFQVFLSFQEKEWSNLTFAMSLVLIYVFCCYSIISMNNTSICIIVISIIYFLSHITNIKESNYLLSIPFILFSFTNIIIRYYHQCLLINSSFNFMQI